MANDIVLTFLGTADAVPSKHRNHTAILLDFQGEHMLFDCGEGTQRQFRKADLNPGKVTRLFISHWHGDHVLGIPGLLQTLSLGDYAKTLYIYGPKGTKLFMQQLLKVFAFTKRFAIVVKEGTGKILDEKDFSVEAVPMKHGIPCNAYVFVKKGKRRIDKVKLKKHKLPTGKHLMKLKEGKNISFEGKTYRAKDLTFQDEDVKVAFIFDTLLNERMVPLAKNAAVLVSEATYSDELKAKAKEHKHLTVKQIAMVAKNNNFIGR